MAEIVPALYPDVQFFDQGGGDSDDLQRELIERLLEQGLKI